MVASIRDFGNKSVFFSSNTHSQQDSQSPTVFSSNYTRMDHIFSETSPDNFKEVKSRTLSPKSQVSRNLLMSSTISSVAYHEKMEHNNAMIHDIDIDNVSPALSYEITQKKAIWISKAVDINNNMATMTQQCVSNELPYTTSPHGDDAVINVPLPYDPNAPMEPDLWDGSFYPISLHSSMVHLALDTKNIKDLLFFMSKYIGNKQVDPAKSNDLEDFKDIGETI